MRTILAVLGFIAAMSVVGFLMDIAGEGYLKEPEVMPISNGKADLSSQRSLIIESVLACTPDLDRAKPGGKEFAEYLADMFLAALDLREQYSEKKAQKEHLAIWVKENTPVRLKGLPVEVQKAIILNLRSIKQADPFDCIASYARRTSPAG